MMATAHTLVAGAIAANVGNPALALPLAFASHFLLDSIPHWDFGTNWRKRTKLSTGVFAITDTVVGLTAAWIFFSNTVPPLILAACLILSLVPDWLEAPWYIFFADQKHTGPKINATPLEKMTYGVYTLTNTTHTKAPFPWGLISQIATVTFFLLVLR
ncbi:MAG: hypothetical protein V1917_01810 [Candidatus Gottesmanbacteria bacterium]